jgi:AbrB family looped-hinge helix DNA binding protein
MRELLLKLSSKGQITIPAAVRRHLGVEKNQRLALVIEPEGTVRLKVPRYPNVAAVQGTVPALGTQRTWTETLAMAHEDRARRKRKRTHG